MSDVFEFQEWSQQSRFLFGEDISNWLDELRSKAIKLRSYRNRLEGVSVGEERSRLVEEEHKLLEWFGEEIRRIHTKFEPYLGFASYQANTSSKIWKQIAIFQKTPRAFPVHSGS
jgi:hypothetical protein